jgi:hypothetical protein
MFLNITDYQATKFLSFDENSVQEVMREFEKEIKENEGYTFEMFKKLITNLLNQFRQPDDKYCVLVSLDEAEHFRALMHYRKNKPLLSSETDVNKCTSANIWIMGDTDMTSIGFTMGYKPATTIRHDTMTTCYRFLNSDTFFTDRSLIILLHFLESNDCDSRESWWLDVRKCRRRRQTDITGSASITTVFKTRDQYSFMEFKSEVCTSVGLIIFLIINCNCYSKNVGLPNPL